MASNLSQISRYVLLSDAAYADFVSKNTGLPFNTETDKSDIAKALAARLRPRPANDPGSCCTTSSDTRS